MDKKKIKGIPRTSLRETCYPPLEALELFGGPMFYGVDDPPEPESVLEDSPVWTMKGILPPETGVCKEAAEDIMQDLGDKINDPEALDAALLRQAEIIVPQHFPDADKKSMLRYIAKSIAFQLMLLKEEQDETIQD